MPEQSPYFLHLKNQTSLDNQSALGCQLQFNAAKSPTLAQLPTSQLRDLVATSVARPEAFKRSDIVSADFWQTGVQASTLWTGEDALVRRKRYRALMPVKTAA